MHKDKKTSHEEFRKSRDAAQMAFGVVNDVEDKLLATKIQISAAFHEFEDHMDTGKSLCLKYLERMNTLPEVAKVIKLFVRIQQSSCKKFNPIDIPMTFLRVKLHQKTFRYVLEIDLHNLFNETRIINQSHDPL